MKIRVLPAGLLAGWLAVPGMAAHITDKLAVGLYDSPNDEEPERILTSGTPLEVLDRGGRLCRVRMGSGQEGWLECRYLSDEKPARAMLVEAQARNAALHRELKLLRDQLEAARQDLQAQENRLMAAERLMGASPDGTPAETSLAESALPLYSPSPAQDAVAAGSGWLAGLVGLAAGFLAGALGFYLRCRRRYGGLRI